MLRLEFETARQLRATNAVLTLALLVGMASFVALLVLRNTVVRFPCTDFSARVCTRALTRMPLTACRAG